MTNRSIRTTGLRSSALAFTTLALIAHTASASAVDKAVLDSCKLYNPDGSFTNSYNLSVRLQGDLPDSVQTGETVRLANARLTLGAGGNTVRIFHGFGDTVGGSLGGFSVAATGTSRAIAAIAPPAIPFSPTALPPIPPDWANPAPLEVRVPEAGTLAPVDLGTAIGPAGSNAVFAVDPTRYTTFWSVTFTQGGSNPVSYTLKCFPLPFVDDDETIPQDLSIASVPVTAPPVSTLPAITKVQGTGIAGIGGFGVITGQRLTGVTAVTVGGKRASNVRKVGTFVTFSAPKLAAGTYDVAVTTPAGTSPASAGAKLRYIKLGF